jgi:hypothetical protein
MVEPPWTTVGARVLGHGAGEAEEIDAEMFEEAPVFRRQHRLDQMVGQFLDRHRVGMQDAALADLVAVAVEEGDGEFVLLAPVAGGFLGRAEGCWSACGAGFPD